MEDDEGTACAVAVREVRCQKDGEERSEVGWYGESL